MLMHNDQHAESAATADEAISVARAVGARQVEAHALNTRGVNLATFGDLDAGIATIGLARTMATELDNAIGVNETLTYEADVLFAVGRYEEAAAAGLLAADHASRHGLAAILGGAALQVTFDALFAVGRWDEAAGALARAQRYGLHAIADLEVQERRAQLEVARGELAAAGRRLERLRPLTVAILAPKVIAPFTTSLAEFEILRGHPLAARSAVDEGMRKVDAASDVWVGHIGQLLAVGIRAEADLASQAAATRSKLELDQSHATGAAFLDRMRTLAREVAQLRTVYRPIAEAWHLMCVAEASRLTGVGQPDRWAAAGVAWVELRMPHERAYTLMREGQAALATRDRRRAADALEAGLLIAVQLGARQLQHEIEELGHRAGLHLRPAGELPRRERPGVAESSRVTTDGIPPQVEGGAPRAGRDLTPREHEVLQLVSAGRTDQEIADALFISPKTASVHVANIKGKLGAESRVAIAMDAIRLGLLDTSR
jgi:DNA-binding NarL/FixJ family response regulator